MIWCFGPTEAAMRAGLDKGPVVLVDLSQVQEIQIKEPPLVAMGQSYFTRTVGITYINGKTLVVLIGEVTKEALMQDVEDLIAAFGKLKK